VRRGSERGSEKVSSWSMHPKRKTRKEEKGMGGIGGGTNLGKLSGKDESDGGLDLPGRDGGLLVVGSELGSLGSDSLEDIVDERVEDGHGLVGDTSVGVDLREGGREGKESASCFWRKGNHKRGHHFYHHRLIRSKLSEKADESAEKKTGRRTNLLEDLVDVGRVGLDSLLVPLLLVALSLGGLGGGGLLSGSLGSRGLGGGCRRRRGREERVRMGVLELGRRERRGRRREEGEKMILTSLLSGSLGGGGGSGLGGHVERVR